MIGFRNLKAIPKVHKTPWSIRPVVNCWKAFSTEICSKAIVVLSDWLVTLKNLGRNHCIGSTKVFLILLETYIAKAPCDNVFISADFSNLYLEIKRKDIYDAIHHFSDSLDISCEFLLLFLIKFLILQFLVIMISIISKSRGY